MRKDRCAPAGVGALLAAPCPPPPGPLTGRWLYGRLRSRVGALLAAPWLSPPWPRTGVTLAAATRPRAVPPPEADRRKHVPTKPHPAAARGAPLLQSLATCLLLLTACGAP